MDQETNHASQLLHWLIENWQFTVLLAGGIFWSTVWSVKKTFPTHRVMRECETDMKDALDRHEREEIIRSLEFKRENLEQHQEIRDDLRHILDYIMRSNQ